MRWQDTVSSGNIEAGQPLSWVERDVLEDNPQFTASRQYANKRAIYLDQHPPDPNSWAASNLPAQMPVGPLADPSAASDPSILARQRAAPPEQWPWSWIPRGWPGGPPGMTLNSAPGQ